MSIIIRKLKIKNNASSYTYTKSDTIYEMSEEEAKAVFNEKLTKEELNLLLKELAKKYPEGFTTIVKKYPNFKTKVTHNQVLILFFWANPFAEKAKGRAIRATW